MAFFSLNTVYWAWYKNIVVSGNPIEQNTQNNINQSQLIEKYIISYKSKIKSLANKYDIENSQIISENIQELDSMIKGLRSTQTKLIEREDASDAIKSVVEWLKIINNNLKPYLKIKQREYENRVWAMRTKYSPATKKVSTQINTLIKKIAEPMTKEKRLSLNQKQILKHLIVLEDESKKLNSFENRDFETISDVKDYLRETIKSIRSELQSIKNLI